MSTVRSINVRILHHVSALFMINELEDIPNKCGNCNQKKYVKTLVSREQYKKCHENDFVNYLLIIKLDNIIGWYWIILLNKCLNVFHQVLKESQMICLK
jgi:hypothetical protein